MHHVQIPTIILPLTPTIVFGTEPETIVTAVATYSSIIPVRHLEDKAVHVMATEIVNVAAPANLSVWIELAPSIVMLGTIPPAAMFAQLGIPTVIVGTGVTATTQGVFLPWRTHSEWCRVGVQMAVASAIDFWMIQVIISGKGG